MLAPVTGTQGTPLDLGEIIEICIDFGVDFVEQPSQPRSIQGEHVAVHAFLSENVDFTVVGFVSGDNAFGDDGRLGLRRETSGFPVVFSTVAFIFFVPQSAERYWPASAYGVSVPAGRAIFSGAEMPVSSIIEANATHQKNTPWGHLTASPFNPGFRTVIQVVGTALQFKTQCTILRESSGEDV